MPAPATESRDLKAKTLHSRDGVVVLEVDRICVAIWRGAVTPISFGWQKDGLDRVVRNHPDGAAFVCVIEPTAKPPDEALRKASTEMVEHHAEVLKCVAVVIEGEGFRAAIARGVISGMILMRSRKVPAHAFSNTRAALRWVNGYLSVTSTETVAKQIEGGRLLLGRIT